MECTFHPDPRVALSLSLQSTMTSLVVVHGNLWDSSGGYGLCVSRCCLPCCSVGTWDGYMSEATNNDQGPQGLSASCHGISHTNPTSGSPEIGFVTIPSGSTRIIKPSSRTEPRGEVPPGSCPRFLQPHPLVCSSHESWLGKGALWRPCPRDELELAYMLWRIGRGIHLGEGSSRS